jgi:hypothetical protein
VPDYDPGFDVKKSLPNLPVNVIGTFEYDQAHDYTLQWQSADELLSWMKIEERANSIELRRYQTHRNKAADAVWDTKIIYKCARDGTGGYKVYRKNHKYVRKITTKRVGCSCWLRVKSYPGTTTLLGSYHSDHSHPLGDENLKYTRLPTEDVRLIEKLLGDGVAEKKIVSAICQPTGD